MSKTSKMSLVAGAWLWPIQAMASEGRGEPADSIVWVFLAFCGLIVVAQFIPFVSHLIKRSKTQKQVGTAEEPPTH